MTLNQIVDHAKRFASVHKSLQGNFFEGLTEDYCNNKANPYPVLIMTLQPTSISQGNKAFSATFGVWDKVELDQRNRLEVQSDTEQICSDLIAYMNNADDLMEVQLPVNIEHAQEVYADDVAGSFFDMIMNTFYSVDVCVVPLLNVTLSASPLSLDFGEVNLNTISASQIITVNGTDLFFPITVTAPVGYNINLDGGTQNDGPLTVSPGALVYVRLAPTEAQNYDGMITVESQGAPTVNISLTGEGLANILTTFSGLGIVTDEGKYILV
jgi:hypothetical protein